MPIRKGKRMHYPCDKCGDKFERFGKNHRICDKCKKEAILNGRGKTVETIKKRKEKENGKKK